MVGKGVEPKSSRIFHQCYLKCCKLQNLTPLAAVLPGCSGKVLDFCVDRIKYQDWPPILNALSCDLSLHSVSIRCRQPCKTVLEQIDCERLAKTVNKRCVLLTNFMLSNLVEAVAQMLSNTTLLNSLLLEGIPLKIPYLNPLCEALLTNSSLQHLYLPRCLIGDAGCLAVCKAVRCLPNILTLDLSGCELTCAGAGYIADLIKYQKIHRYSENWLHTLRYRFPELDSMAGLRRITVCGNPQLGDQGMAKLLDVLADDLWIKALDAQNCGLTEQTVQAVMDIMRSNETLVILDLRQNADICSESLSQVRAALREHERAKGVTGQYSWLGVSSTYSSDRSVRPSVSKNLVQKDRLSSNTRNTTSKYSKSTVAKKEKDYTEILQEQLHEEISHRQQLEELNMQLVDQMKQLKQQQIQLWAQGGATSSGSEQSFEASARSCDLSSSSGSTSSVPIDQNTLSYIQQAFKDIYAFIKNNQCNGRCLNEIQAEKPSEDNVKEVEPEKDALLHLARKKAASTHTKLNVKVEKITKSAHIIGDTTPNRNYKDNIEMKPQMFERQMGDSKSAHGDEVIISEDIMTAQYKEKKIQESGYDRPSPCSSVVSDSSETLVVSPRHSESSEHSGHSYSGRSRSGRSRSGRSRSSRSANSILCAPPNPRDALCSSSDDDTDDST